MDDYELLGPAEKQIAKQLRAAFEGSVKPLREMTERVEKLAEVDWEAALLDPKKKDSAVAFTDVVGSFPRRLADLSLVLLMSEAIFAKEAASA